MKRKCFLLQFDEVEYGEAWGFQKALLDARISGEIEDCFILLQHPPTFTYGRRYKEDNLIANRRYYENVGFAVYKTDRGGLATYHGTGQVVGYPIIKLSTYTKDYHQYLRMLEEVMIRTLIGFGIMAERKEGYTGVWVGNAKIGFVGVRMAFGYITPCGIQGLRITSIRELTNSSVDMKKVYDTLVRHYSDVFQVQLIPIEMGTMTRRIGFENICEKI